MRSFDYFRPTTVAEARQLLAEHGEHARVMAGGTALLIVLKHRLFAPEILIDIKGIADLDYVSANGELRVGAVVTHRAIERAAVVRDQFPLLATTASRVANVQVRNKGTLAGNLCQAEPASDPGTVLLAHDARVTLVSSAGERVVPLDRFFVGFYETVARPDELLAEIQIPRLPTGAAGVYKKFTPRSTADKPTVGVAVVLQLDPAGRGVREARIALGNCGPTPLRCREAEARLQDNTFDDRLAEEAGRIAASEARPFDDIRASAEYRREAIAVLVKRALIELGGA